MGKAKFSEGAGCNLGVSPMVMRNCEVGSLSEMTAKVPSFGFVKHFIILCLHIKRTSVSTGSYLN